MGNMVDGEEDFEIKRGKKERLPTEEIPPDTQMYMEQQENNENDIKEDIQGELNQQDEEFQQYQDNQEDPEVVNIPEIKEEPERQEILHDEEIQEEQINQDVAIEPELQEFHNNNNIEQQNQELQDEEEQQENQDVQEGKLHIGRYRFVQDGELYQVNENGKIYKVIQDPQNSSRDEIPIEQIDYQNNQVLKTKIAKPIFQNIQQNQTYQQNPYFQEIHNNNQSYMQYIPYKNYQSFQQYQQFQQSHEYPDNTDNIYNKSYQPYLDNKQIIERHKPHTATVACRLKKKPKIKKKSSPIDKVLTEEEKKKIPNKVNRKMKKPEPKDSISKMNIVSNKGHILPNQNKSIYMNINVNKKYRYTKGNEFNINNNNTIRNQFLRSCNTKTVRSRNQLGLGKDSGFNDIPRFDYDKYADRETLVLNDGMDTGEYKFIGEKTTLKEPEENFNKNINIDRELLLKEINRRKKTRNEKKIKFEVVDRFYTLTEINHKNIKKLENSNCSENKTNFYSTFTNDYSNSKNCYSVNDRPIPHKGLYNLKKNVGIGIRGKVIGGGSTSTSGYGSNYSYKTSKNRKSRNFDGEFYKIYDSNKDRNSKAISGANSNNYTACRTEIPIDNNLSNILNTNAFFNSFENKNSITSMPTDNFSKYLLEQINKIRSDPESFIGVIENAKANITKDRFGRLVFNGKIKIALANGESAFSEAIKFLKKIEPMEPLKYLSYLTVLPPQNEKEIRDKEDLNKKVSDMINGGIAIKSYWRDVINDPEISFLLMIVDDNGVKSGMRRKDLLNPRMKFIGISSVEIKKNFVCYITLSS